MINFKNVAENLVLVLISVIVGVFIGSMVTIKTSKTIIDAQKTTIELAIKKQTTSITNNVITEFKKLKATKSEPINIIIDPATKSVITQKKDTARLIKVKREKGFFKRLFSKRAY